MSLKDQVAIVGVGQIALPVGEGTDLSAADLGILAAQAALDDAGLTRRDVQALAWATGMPDPGGLAAALGVPEVTFSATVTGGPGGGPGALALAASSIVGGFGDVCLSIISASPAPRTPARSSLFQANPVAGAGPYGGPAFQQAEDAFWQPAEIATRGATVAMITCRYLHEHNIARGQLGHVVVNQWANAGDALTMDDYLDAAPIIGPLSHLDASAGLDRAVASAVVTTTAERAKDLKQVPILIGAGAMGGTPSHASQWQTPGSGFASSGHRDVARDLYEMAGVGPDQVDIVLFHDDFSPMVLMQLEDYGFCLPGEAAAFVADGRTQIGGELPVNTHGGNLSSAHGRGMTHLAEAIEQLRGRATNQVTDAEVALVTGSPATIPLSAVLLRRAS
jgi:acetyl-CoA acetyltransferase